MQQEEKLWQAQMRQQVLHRSNAQLHAHLWQNADLRTAQVHIYICTISHQGKGAP